MTVTRADKLTQLNKKQEFFSDFLTNFERHPVSGALARVTNEESIKQSLKNLILTNVGERIFQPNFGSNVRRSLFEPNDKITAQNIVYYIKNSVSQNEPRVALSNVVVYPSPDEGTFTVNIVFYIINNPVTPVTLNLILRRVR
jgi:phage baseplate assembly protein W